MNKPAKTINQRYTKKQRAEIAERLRFVASLDPTRRDFELSGEARIYVQRVFRSYGAITIMDLLDIFGVDWFRAPYDVLHCYVAEMLNRLAGELEGVK